jgi:hypothetical protein
VYRDGSLVVSIHGGKQVEQGRFSRTTFPYDGHKFTFVYIERYILQDLEVHRFFEVFIDVVYG